MKLKFLGFSYTEMFNMYQAIIPEIKPELHVQYSVQVLFIKQQFKTEVILLHLTYRGGLIKTLNIDLFS